MKVLINFTLTLVLTVILLIPIISAHFVISPVDQKGFVAGLKSISEKEINIIPNFKDFNDYVAFSPSLIQDGKYQDILGITSFARQKALYRGLYSIYNISADQSLSIELVTPGIAQNSLQEAVALDRIVISLAKNEHNQTLSMPIEKGSTVLRVSSVEGFNEDESVLIGEELAEVVAISTDGLVVTPLTMNHEEGEMVYAEPIVLSADRVINPRTQKILLVPGEKATVDASVRGTADLLLNDQMIEIPLVFKLKARY